MRVARASVVALCTGGLLVPLLALAQASVYFSVPGSEHALTIEISPRFPEPGQDVTLTLRSVLYDLSVSDIYWSKDGERIAEGVGKTDVTTPAGKSGDSSVIQAVIASPSGSASTEVTLAPTSLELLWEADTYTPPFYLGRALPTAGSNIRLVALAHFVRPDGSTLPPSSIIYTWRKDGRVLESLSGRGKSSAVIEGPTLFGTEVITVSAESADGSLSGEATLKIGDNKPVLRLYQDNPLSGILYGQALEPTSVISENEATFVAVPYFAPPGTVAKGGLEYSWSVNDTPVASDSARTDELTINAASSSGLALIKLSVTHDSNFFFSLSGIWNITLGGRGAVTNPFY